VEAGRLESSEVQLISGLIASWLPSLLAVFDYELNLMRNEK